MQWVSAPSPHRPWIVSEILLLLGNSCQIIIRPWLERIRVAARGDLALNWGRSAPDQNRQQQQHWRSEPDRFFFFFMMIMFAANYNPDLIVALYRKKNHGTRYQTLATLHSDRWCWWSWFSLSPRRRISGTKGRLGPYYSSSGTRFIRSRNNGP